MDLGGEELSLIAAAGGRGSGDLLDIDVIGPHICQGLHFSPLFSHLHESVDAVLALKGFVKTPAPAPHLLYACHRRHPGAEKRGNRSAGRAFPGGASVEDAVNGQVICRYLCTGEDPNGGRAFKG